MSNELYVTIELKAVDTSGKIYSITKQDYGVMSETSFHTVEKAVANALLSLGDIKPITPDSPKTK